MRKSKQLIQIHLSSDKLISSFIVYKSFYFLQPYREAFKKMSINPNKFPCSVEALSARAVKSGTLPDINPIVNLVNTYSLKNTLPMGAHDLDQTESNIEVR
ncbi:MAG: phenylalanine--tRNA ligase beta subunit-related protein [Bacillota bacterium]